MISSVEIKKYYSKIAYPTIILTMVAILGHVLSTYAYIYIEFPVVAVIVINTIMAYILFTSMHEAAHNNISGSNRKLSWVDELIGWVSGISLFAPFYLFKVIHFRHHAFTNNPEKDPDHWLASSNIVSLLFHSTTIFPVYFIKSVKLLFFEKNVTKIVKKELWIGIMGLVVFYILLAAFVFGFGWKVALVTWIIPAFLAQIGLAIAFDWLPHHPHDEQERYLDTRIFDVKGITFLLLFQNYHLIHHLFPRIPFYDYKEVFLKIKNELKKKGTEIIGSTSS